ncbi:MAG TPA: PEP-CTERM sorting domain-containing protein [Candidatus Bathyarchaeia archaeon]|nr:PEP-CTERM sorting domain-containing protein [Candidatus Bathyarchaeia archaeon]
MMHSQWLRVALLVAALVGLVPGFARADLDADLDLVRVPEPATLTLLASGIVALGGIGWFRRRK